MSLRKNGIGYYVEGRNGLPGRSFPKLSEAQRYDQEIERAACAPPKTTTQLLAELYSDLVRWRDAGGDVRELRYVFETMDQISAEKALRLTLDDPRALASLTAKLTTPEAAKRHVDYWADAGATSFKAYMQISRSVLGAAIQAAHARGIVPAATR